MLPTPSTSHVNYDHIYEPAEDSFLLLDTLSSESESCFLRARFATEHSAPLVLEVGTGSGVVLAFMTTNATQIFGRADVATIGTDLNPFACEASQQTVQFALSDRDRPHPNSVVFLGVINCDLATTIAPGSVDVLVFNPPYVPSEDLTRDSRVQLPDDTFERDSYLLSLSTDGGMDGMEITNRLLTELGRVLSERGVAYILLCSQNKPDQVISRVRAWPILNRDGQFGKWSALKVSSSGRQAGWERLCVIRISRDQVS